MSNNSQAKNAVQQMAEKMMPGLQTDHGGINLGDIVVLLISSVLLVYTGYRSWHFLSVSIPEDFQILALVGLWGIDIAMIGWAVVWIFGSSSAGQDGVSMSMWVIDVIAMVLTSVIDTIMYADGSTVPPIFRTVAWYGVPLIIVGNAVMAVVYHFTSPSTKYRREQRRLDAHINESRQKGDHEIREITATADLLQEHSMKRANALLSIANVAKQNVQMVEMEQGVLKMLNQAGLGHLAGPLGYSQEPQSPTQDESVEGLMAKLSSTLNDSNGKSSQTNFDIPHLTDVIKKTVPNVRIPSHVTYDQAWAMDIFVKAMRGSAAWLVAAQACQDAGLHQLVDYAVEMDHQRNKVPSPVLNPQYSPVPISGTNGKGASGASHDPFRGVG